MRQRLTYANVVSTIALFLVLTGGVVYAASKIRTKDIQRQAVTQKKLAPDAVKNGKLAEGAVGTAKLAEGAVTNAKVKDDSIEPQKLTFPVFYTASPSGGSQPVTGGQPNPYPISGGQWTQRANAINVVFGEATATLAYDGTGSGSCQVFFDLRINGQQVGGGQIQTNSPTLEQVTGELGAGTSIGPLNPEQRTLTIQIGSNGDCVAGSTIDSTRFKVLDFG